MTKVIIRQLKEHDLFNGFLESLDSLRKASDLDKEKAEKIFKKIESDPNQVIFVAVLNEKVIGSTTLIIEQKFIHGGGKVSHIEDVAVSQEFQGKGIGKKLITASLDFSKKSGFTKHCESNELS